MDCEDHVVPPVKFLERYDSNQSAASLTLHENDAVHVQLTSGTSSRWNNELRCIGFGWLRSPISINQESEDNIEHLPLYHVPCVTLCTLSLSCQITLTKRQKKKKIVRCQCTTKLTQVSSFSELHTSHGRARHQIWD